MKLRWYQAGKPQGELAIDKKIVTVGTDARNDLVLTGSGIAEHHLHLMVKDGQAKPGSRGGHPFEVPGSGSKDRGLTAGDRLRIGEIEIEILAVDEREPPPGRALPAEESLERLLRFHDRLSTIDSPARLLEELLDLLIRILGAQRGMVVMGSADTPHVRLARGLEAGSVEESLRRVPDRLLRAIFEKGEPVAMMDVRSGSTFTGSTSIVELGLQAVLALPLRTGGQVVGVLFFASDVPSPLFTDAGLRETRLYAAQASWLLERMTEVEHLEATLDRTREALERWRQGSLLSALPGLASVTGLLERLAPSDLSILITGETGTGKEVVARELHRLGRGPEAPFVAVNCGAIPEGLIESELFGHARGAFSGAVEDRAGRLESASGGTLFLDEIGEMPPAVQVRLLRALQERKITRVGETRERAVQFRLVAATHRNLGEAIQRGDFRQDLYYRVREVEIALPPLRERLEDIDVLTGHFLGIYGERYRRSRNLRLSDEARGALRAHAWPGNVRELEGRLKRAAVLATTELIAPEHLELGSSPTSPPPIASPAGGDTLLPLEEAVRQFRNRYVLSALEAHGGSRKNTAAALGVDPRTIHRYLSGGGGDD